MNPAIRILVVDDHAIVRMGLIALLRTEPDFEVVGEAEDGNEAIKKAQELKPDIVVMDILMPGCNGIEATAGIRKVSRRTRIVVLTTSSSARDLVRIREAGAKGVVMKGSANEDLITAIRKVAIGEHYITPEAESLLVSTPNIPPKMTERQTEILGALSRGLTNKEIAKICGVSTNCIKLHVTTILNKLGASNRAEAVTIALCEHIIPTRN